MSHTENGEADTEWLSRDKVNLHNCNILFFDAWEEEKLTSALSRYHFHKVSTDISPEPCYQRADFREHRLKIPRHPHYGST